LPDAEQHLFQPQQLWKVSAHSLPILNKRKNSGFSHMSFVN
jgi:hypothetical protein